ncbi:MAG: hypothetical protein ACM3S4_00320 [Burkholderiales bacterium]
MKFEFDGYVPDLPFNIAIFLMFLKLLLLAKRVLNLFLRLLTYTISVIPIILLIPLLAFLLWLIHIENSYPSYWYVFWDMRYTIITSVLISYTIVAFQTERNRKKRLNELYSIYDRIKNYFNAYTKDFFQEWLIKKYGLI